MRRKWLLCGILCGVVSLSVFGQNVGASNYDKQIKETEKQQKEWRIVCKRKLKRFRPIKTIP